VGDTAAHQQQVSVSALADGGVLAGPVVSGRALVQLGCVPFPLGTPSETEGIMPSQINARQVIFTRNAGAKA
jgi:hypothetical protein